MLSEAGRARVVKGLRKDAARKTRRLVAVVCRPENVDKVRKFVEEASVDIRIITDPKAPGLFRHLGQQQLEEDYPEEARKRAESPGPSAVAEKGASGEVRVVIHRPERPQTIRIETGPEGTSIHLNG